MTGEIKTTRKVDDAGEWVLTEHFFIDGKEVDETAFRTAFPEQEGTPMFGNSPRAWPWVSDSLAVHSKQIGQVKERNARHGLNIEYDRKGRPVCTDAGQRKKLMKLEGVRQQNSYYGA